MKKLFILSVFLLIYHFGRAQKSPLDSLLAKTDQAAGRGDLIKLISAISAIPNGDIALLKKGKTDLAGTGAPVPVEKQEHALMMICAGSYGLHDSPGLLDASLRGTHISHIANDAHYLSVFLCMAAQANRLVRDYRKTTDYFLLAANVATAAHDTIILLEAYSNLESSYIDLKKNDSALFWAKRESAVVNQFNNPAKADNERSALSDIGEVLTTMGQLDSALIYYRQSYNIAKKYRLTNNLSFLLNNMAKTYLRKAQPDSALKYASESYDLVAKTKDWIFTAGAADILSKVYQGRDDKKSLFYLKVKMAAVDSINDNEKSRQFQLIADREQQHDRELQAAQERFNARVSLYVFIGVATVLLIIGIALWRNNQNQKQTNRLLSSQKEEISAQRDNLEEVLDKLKTAQTQLIQSEKMASLGELTAGIAHEIQNPLNFVNNFSEVNAELIDEINEELDKGDIEEAKAIGADLKQNLEKIRHHGKRADAIVKGMLQHSQSGNGTKELTNINPLADEVMQMAFHGLRSKDKSVNVELITNFDINLPAVNIISQDISRVFLNLFNNAFYAVSQKLKMDGTGYKPKVTVTTSVEKSQVAIKVKDNGIGIPDAIKDKIMQPFFTTKPTGEGTGLGLSLSYDIVVKGHGGSIKVNTIEGAGSEFAIYLPIIQLHEKTQP